MMNIRSQDIWWASTKQLLFPKSSFCDCYFTISWITRCYLTYGSNKKTWQIHHYTNMHLKLSPVVILSLLSFFKNLSALGIWNNIFYWPIFDLYLYSHIFNSSCLSIKTGVWHRFGSFLFRQVLNTLKKNDKLSLLHWNWQHHQTDSKIALNLKMENFFF